MTYLRQELFSFGDSRVTHDKGREDTEFKHIYRILISNIVSFVESKVTDGLISKVVINYILMVNGSLIKRYGCYI